MTANLKHDNSNIIAIIVNRDSIVAYGQYTVEPLKASIFWTLCGIPAQ